MYKAQAVSEHFVHEWDESIGEPYIVVCEKGLDQIGEAMSKEDAESIAKEWNESEGFTEMVNVIGSPGYGKSSRTLAKEAGYVDDNIVHVGSKTRALTASEMAIMLATRGFGSNDVALGKTLQEVIEPERGITLGLTNTWKDLSPLHSYSPFDKKKRNTNRTPPKKKRKKK